MPALTTTRFQPAAMDDAEPRRALLAVRRELAALLLDVRPGAPRRRLAAAITALDRARG